MGIKDENKNRQLYTLLRRLESSVENKDDLGMLIGYSLVNSMFQFETKSGSEEEVKFDEMKAIHQGLEDAIQKCIDRGSFAALCDLMTKVSPVIKNPQLGETKSMLIGDLLEEFSKQKNQEDKLKRRGLRLLYGIRGGQPLKGTQNILREDYEAIKNYFVYGG